MSPWRPPERPAAAATLVVGYGNTLRSDDAVGRLVAEAVADWKLPNVRAISIHQLTPEIAEELAWAELVIFVDACVAEGPSDTVRMQPVVAGPAQGVGHIGDPALLLDLAATLYGVHPRSWLVAIPVTQFALGEELSLAGRCGVIEALQQIRQLLAREGEDHA